MFCTKVYRKRLTKHALTVRQHTHAFEGEVHHKTVPTDDKDERRLMNNPENKIFRELQNSIMTKTENVLLLDVECKWAKSLH